MIDHNERAEAARALRQAAADARAMHDPVAPDCEEWASWLDARADRVVSPISAGTHVTDGSDSSEPSLETVLTTWYTDEARGTHLDFDDLPTLVKRIEAHYATVQPPTREQIAAEAYAVVRPVARFTDLGPGGQAIYLQMADAVLALFPQPTPTAEPCGRKAWPHEEYQDEDDACICLLDGGHEGLHQCGAGCGVEFAGGLPAEPMVPLRAVIAVMDHYDNGDGECEPEDRWRLFRDMRSLLESKQVGRSPAEPVSIADMAPGTTFTGRIWGETDDELWFRTALGAVSASGVRASDDHIDPSTIRDVTPPPATPEEGDRG
ncbi:hypothetical protein [Curtobacterium sp. MCBD17_021]|uniref:hypothetical protein n=1 Tax=Curtobacterium sp. MCBD17_021 TaxID=2175665 RepID=UPI000DA98026|nr:hypothetical protein [Curtobacterium sp. MCBD17_021]PZE66914.1 hypothetical protein DEI83_06290 [Curtobacterium sp. MCBD17_021]